MIYNKKVDRFFYLRPAFCLLLNEILLDELSGERIIELAMCVCATNKTQPFEKEDCVRSRVALSFSAMNAVDSFSKHMLVIHLLALFSDSENM